MEGKGVRAVIMGLLILGLVVAQIEAKSCCRNTTGRNCYNTCRFAGGTQSVCASLCDCIHVTGNCPSTHPRSNMLESSGDMINEYCKLGCASSVCDTISTNQNSGEGEVNEAVEHCVNACSELCNKGAKTA
ncbi:Thionin [Thalictrum thalictroides]|uniref:Thionin n=1 Tax=Thalictrum thalictroides TaxID=46969 RepID=A0A7J6X1J1_THATH|nr:Thionin [Thalictrum thalictroides]